MSYINTARPFSSPSRASIIRATSPSSVHPGNASSGTLSLVSSLNCISILEVLFGVPLRVDVRYVYRVQLHVMVGLSMSKVQLHCLECHSHSPITKNRLHLLPFCSASLSLIENKLSHPWHSPPSVYPHPAFIRTQCLSAGFESSQNHL
jgi:hypothetical protein